MWKLSKENKDQERGNVNSCQAILEKTEFFFFFSSTTLLLPTHLLHPRAHMLSHVIPWTAARQAPLSMGFSRQDYWNGLPFPSPGKN